MYLERFRNGKWHRTARIYSGQDGFIVMWSSPRAYSEYPYTNIITYENMMQLRAVHRIPGVQRIAL